MDGVWAQLLTSPILVAAIVAAVVSVLVSVLTVRATREAALKHAIETEALKLRYSISVRHMNTFYGMAEPLRAVLVELPHNREVADRFEKHVYPQTPLNVRLYAELATLPELYERAQSIQKTFMQAIYALARKIQAAGPDPDARPEADSCEITGYSIASVNALLYLMRVVDLSSEVRVSSPRGVPDMQRFDDMLTRWDQVRRTLRPVPPDPMSRLTPEPPSRPE